MIRLVPRGYPSVGCASCDWHARVASIGQLCAMHERLATLAANLAIAGALCAAFTAGYRFRSTEEAIANGRAYLLGNDWRPGCGRTAAGWSAR